MTVGILIGLIYVCFPVGARFPVTHTLVWFMPMLYHGWSLGQIGYRREGGISLLRRGYEILLVLGW